MAGAEPTRTRLLVVEDEPTLADAIALTLRTEGYDVETVADGRDAVRRIQRDAPDLVILDVMLPSMSGLDVLRAVRAAGSTVPIIMLTARDTEADVVAGLELGADDYVKKPFSMRELVSRVRARLRGAAGGVERPEASPDQEEVLTVGPIVMNVDRHEVRVAGRPVELRPKEFEVLELLMRRAGRLVTRDELIDEVWGFHRFDDTGTLTVHVKRIREKIEPDPRAPRHLLTVRGLGYKLVGDDDR